MNKIDLEDGSTELKVLARCRREAVGLKGLFARNSGVFLMGPFAVQILDSFENKTYASGQAAVQYGQFPQVNASRHGSNTTSCFMVRISTVRGNCYVLPDERPAQRSSRARQHRAIGRS